MPRPRHGEQPMTPTQRSATRRQREQARRDEVTRLRFALADIETLAETLGEAQRMASDALALPAAIPSRKPD